MMFELKQYLKERQDLVNRYLQERVPTKAPPAPIIFEAMNYSLSAGGKRLRPILVLASWEACSRQNDLPKYPEDVMAAACALEMIHTYSLIHDDLPAMDDDDLRRGKPTNHKVYGEATAILAGDALLSEAFAALATAMSDDSDAMLRVIAKIASASGAQGMAGGQVLDLQAEGQKITPEELETLHRYKTGCLIHVSCIAGGELAGASAEQMQALDTYGMNIGLAFQIADDILDVEGGTEQLGKTVGADAAHDKNTYPSVLGINQSKQKEQALIDNAVVALTPFGPHAEPLSTIARYIISRSS
jgi:geranylgeranyl diphosphate synthase type II